MVILATFCRFAVVNSHTWTNSSATRTIERLKIAEFVINKSLGELDILTLTCLSRSTPTVSFSTICASWWVSIVAAQSSDPVEAVNTRGYEDLYRMKSSGPRRLPRGRCNHKVIAMVFYGSNIYRHRRASGHGANPGLNTLTSARVSVEHICPTSHFGRWRLRNFLGNWRRSSDKKKMFRKHRYHCVIVQVRMSVRIGIHWLSNSLEMQ